MQTCVSRARRRMSSVYRGFDEPVISHRRLWRVFWVSSSVNFYEIFSMLNDTQ